VNVSSRCLSWPPSGALDGLNDDYAAIVRLLMLTGQRRDEIANLVWGEVGPDAITLPAARSKNKREHVIPLSEPARAILAARPRCLRQQLKPLA
jgi:integrase